MDTHKKKTSPDFEDNAEAFIKGIIPDLPLLMYSSGDAHPTQVDPATVHLIATLTKDYVERLVEAAVDAHDILTDGSGGVLPKAAYEKRKRDDWDDDLPSPKIKNHSRKTQGGYRREDGNTGGGVVSDEQWQGAKGVNLYENRIRCPHQSIPRAIGAQSFIFPICHDAELYNKVNELNTFGKHELKSLKAGNIGALIDPTVINCIEEEEAGLDHLSNSLFHWVTAGKSEEGVDAKASNEMTLTKRKDLARSLVNRTGIEAKLPGVENLLLPMHCVQNHAREKE